MQFNWDVCGHAQHIDSLQNSIRNNTLTHAYIFSGPANIGKTKVLEQFILSLVCLSEIKPCLTCSHCKMIKKGTYPDLDYVLLEEEAKDISVAQIRKMISRLNYKKLIGNYKIAVIGQAEKMNKSSFNCLLKTMEEPSLDTIIVLLTSNLSVILDTLKSRSCVLHFKPVATDTIKDYLITSGLDIETAIKYSSSGGRVGKSISFTGHEGLFLKEQQKNNEIIGLLNSDLTHRFAFAESIVKQDKDSDEDKVSLFLAGFIDFLHDMMFLKTGNNEYVESIDNQESLEKAVGKYSLKEIAEILEESGKAMSLIKNNINTKLLLQNLFLLLK